MTTTWKDADRQQEEVDVSVQAAAAAWDRDISRRALDELFLLAGQYRSTEAYWELMQFVGRFRWYAPFNAMLVRAQMSGATFVAPASRWKHTYGRRIRPGARPLVILQPMGPVMLVFDVSDTVPEPDAPPLPAEVERPFEIRGHRLGQELDRTIQNARRDGVDVTNVKLGSQGGGSITAVQSGGVLHFPKRMDPAEFVDVPYRYHVLLSEGHPREQRYATLVHELAHLYCGHLGTPNSRWWPDRRFVTREAEEFEAESVSYLVCRRLGLETTSERYLAGYQREETPEISLECVLKAAGLIEQMGRRPMPPRQEKRK